MTTTASRRVWTRYVAIGDSFTEGMSDPDPTRPGTYVGWADRLAHHLDAVAEREHLPFGYANLAVRGRKLHDVVGLATAHAVPVDEADLHEATLAPVGPPYAEAGP